jgi:cysteine desulfurase
MSQIYLDYAAATPMDPLVLKAMEPYFSEKFYNPSATYLAARALRSDIDDIRRQIGAQLGAKPAEIVFTAGATEANNLAIQGIMRQYPEAEVLVSAIEHESVLAPAELFRSKKIPVDPSGTVLLNKLSNLISDKTVLISVMLVNNELGSIQPLREIADLLRKVRDQRLTAGNKLPIYLHADAAQAGNYLDIHASRLGVDMMSINGGKIYGPKQSGVLYVKAGTRLEPQILGGGQEFGLRSGTENIAAAAGLAAALELAAGQRAAERARVIKLRDDFVGQVIDMIPGASINGAKANRAPHIASLTIPGSDNERLMMELDERGIQCAVGSACSASRGQASHVLSAIGLSESDARATLRFSFGRRTTAVQLIKTAQALHDLTL